MLNETKDDTEVTLNVISDLLDDIEQDLEVMFFTPQIYIQRLAYYMPHLDHHCP